ncbi:hypothetical protein BPUTEOSOX_1035, partial [thiotrophic endosymbiont of Bathymodiolus puteoserpentis (Logatchev)]
ATFKGLVENNLMYSFENATNYQNTASNAIGGLHDDGEIGGTGDSWKQYAKSGDIVLDLAGGLGGVVGAGRLGAGEVAVGANKVVGRVGKAKALKTVNTQKQFIDLFEKNKANNQITIGNTKLTALPKSGGAKVFKGASDKQVMTYFEQLTGGKLPKPITKKFKVGNNKFEDGVIYKIKTEKGSFTLRNKSASNLSDGSKPRWTIDVIFKGNRKKEAKFK